MKQEFQGDARPTGTWAFLTNHAHVLLCVARDPNPAPATSPSRSASPNELPSEFLPT